MKEFDKKSTCFYAYDYDEASEVLTLKFKHGVSIYKYFNVSKSDFNDFITSPSRGGAFNTFIRNHHSFARVT